MSQNYEDFKENYLKTPQHFKDIVKYQVENEVNKSSQEDMKKDMHKNMQKNKQKRMKNAGRKKSHLRWSPVKIAVCACACILVIGGGAYAANQFRTTKGLQYPVTDDSAADYIEIEEVSISPQTFPGIPKVMAELYGDTNDGIEEATLSVKEVFYDGLSLSVYAEPTEYGKQYELFNPDQGLCPRCHSHLVFKGERHWDGLQFPFECAVCGAGGDLVKDENGEFKFVLDPEKGLCRDRNINEAREEHLNEIIQTRIDFFQRQEEVQKLYDKYKNMKFPTVE